MTIKERYLPYKNMVVQSLAIIVCVGAYTAIAVKFWAVLSRLFCHTPSLFFSEGTPPLHCSQHRGDGAVKQFSTGLQWEGGGNCKHKCLCTIDQILQKVGVFSFFCFVFFVSEGYKTWEYEPPTSPHPTHPPVKYNREEPIVPILSYLAQK